jgi:hypothetical protein
MENSKALMRKRLILSINSGKTSKRTSSWE